MVRVIVFVLGSEEYHLDRCTAVAKVLVKRLKVKLYYLSKHRFDDPRVERLSKDPFKHIIGLGADLVVFDQNKTPKSLITKFKSVGIKTVSHNYKDSSRHFCDIKFSLLKTEYSTVPSYYEGAEYVVLHKDFYHGYARIKRHARKVVIHLKNGEDGQKLLKALKGFDITIAASIKPECIRQHDFVITTMGYPAFQCIATGIPTLIMPTNNFENELINNLSLNALINLGPSEKLTIKHLRRTLRDFSCALAKRKSMSYHAKCLVNRNSWDNIHKIYKKTLEG